jgi:hypothetical protein
MIAWISEETHLQRTAKKICKSTKLSGHYLLRVKQVLGKEEIVEAQNDWVENNFLPAMLAAVQKVAYQKKAVVETAKPKDKKNNKEECG